MCLPFWSGQTRETAALATDPKSARPGHFQRHVLFLHVEPYRLRRVITYRGVAMADARFRDAPTGAQRNKNYDRQSRFGGIASHAPYMLLAVPVFVWIVSRLVKPIFTTVT
jgi:hypothetical protein